MKVSIVFKIVFHDLEWTSDNHLEAIIMQMEFGPLLCFYLLYGAVEAKIKLCPYSCCQASSILLRARYGHYFQLVSFPRSWEKENINRPFPPLSESLFPWAQSSQKAIIYNTIIVFIYWIKAKNSCLFNTPLNSSTAN